MASDLLGTSWHISPQGFDLITENNTIKDKARILQNALDTDFKEIGSSILNKELAKGQLSNIVLQIQKIRNISAPKANENSQAAPRMLKIVLTDGECHVQAIEMTFVSFISNDKTAPGSKLLITSANVVSGYILLTSNNCKLLGGKVPHLYEKWELAKSVQYHNRLISSSDGPPAWVNFGCKISSNTPDKQFKSLENKTKDGIKEKDEFELQRQGAIAEATSGAVKKVFGGGTKQQIQQQNQITNFRRPEQQQQQQQQINRNNREDRRIKSKPGMVKEIEERPQKPQERVSLFDFLEDKLPPTETKESTNKTAPNSTPKYYNTSTSQYVNQQYNNRKQNYNSQENNYYNNRSNESFKKFNVNNQRYENNYRNNPRSNNDQKFENNRSNSFNKPINNREEVVNNKSIDNLGNNLEKMSINSQFASRSLRQHLNLGPKPSSSTGGNNLEWKSSGNTTEWKTGGNTTEWKTGTNTTGWKTGNNTSEWKTGDLCLAKYWEDGKFYEASIIGITDKTYVVNFKGYGNTEEVLKHDCLPFKQNDSFQKQNAGSREFRRSANTYNRRN